MRFLAVIGALAIIAAFGAAIYFFGGFYNVAENVDNPAIVDWALSNVRAAAGEEAAQVRRRTIGEVGD